MFLSILYYMHCLDSSRVQPPRDPPWAGGISRGGGCQSGQCQDRKDGADHHHHHHSTQFHQPKQVSVFQKKNWQIFWTKNMFVSCYLMTLAQWKKSYKNVKIYIERIYKKKPDQIVKTSSSKKTFILVADYFFKNMITKQQEQTRCTDHHTFT